MIVQTRLDFEQTSFSDFAPMIAGKTTEEILSMGKDRRCRWYKKIMPDEKGEAMKIVHIAGRAKLKAWWTPERVAERNAKISEAWTLERKEEQSVRQTGSIRAEKTKAKMSAIATGKNNPNFNNWSSRMPYCHLWDGPLREKIRNRYGRICVLTDTLRSVMGSDSGLDDFAGYEIFSKERLCVHHIYGNKMAGCDGTELALIPLQRKFNNKKFDGFRLEDHPFYITLFLLKDIERRHREEMIGVKEE